MRYVSIDALRMLAIVLMVVVHFAENLAAADPAATSGLCHAIVWIPGDFAAPLFTLLLGVSYRLWVRGREARGDDDEAITKASIRRGLFLFGLGIAFNVLVWLPEDTFNWDVLTFLGVAMIVLAATRAAPPGVHLLAAAAAAAVSPTLRTVSDYAAFWTPGSFDPDLTVADVGLGFLCTGYFPVFPWIAYPLAGYAVAPAVFPDAGGRTSWWPVASGAALMAGAIASLIGGNPLPAAAAQLPIGGWSMFPATTAYVCFTLGAVLVALPLAHRILDHGGATCALARRPVTARPRGSPGRFSSTRPAETPMVRRQDAGPPRARATMKATIAFMPVGASTTPGWAEVRMPTARRCRADHHASPWYP